MPLNLFPAPYKNNWRKKNPIIFFNIKGKKKCHVFSTKKKRKYLKNPLEKGQGSFSTSKMGKAKALQTPILRGLRNIKGEKLTLAHLSNP